MHVQKLLQRLREHELYVKPEKCSFDCKQVEFLGYIILVDGNFMDLAKVQNILEWRPRYSVQDVQYFLGFANFYRKFTCNDLNIVFSLT